MGWQTTEAVQCQLGTLGVILWPSITGLAPEFINDEDIYRLELKIFPYPNCKGIIYKYSRNESRARWFLIESE